MNLNWSLGDSSNSPCEGIPNFFGLRIDKHRHECHVSRPTKDGFPKVRDLDWCSYWTDPDTLDRPFFYLLPIRGADCREMREERSVANVK